MTCKTSGRAWVLLFGMCVPLQAMDRWSALSQIESGDNDHAVGRRGEISRYQMLPEVWRRYAPASVDWKKPGYALSVAKVVMRERSLVFERRFRRSPTDLEFYILWNAPAQIVRPSKIVYKRAERFQNLLRPEPPTRQAALDQRSWPFDSRNEERMLRPAPLANQRDWRSNREGAQIGGWAEERTHAGG